MAQDTDLEGSTTGMSSGESVSSRASPQTGSNISVIAAVAGIENESMVNIFYSAFCLRGDQVNAQ